MARRKMTQFAVLILFLAGAAYAAWAVLNHSFSAREKPSRTEVWLARHARRIATPADAKSLHNPYPATEENLAAARQHFVGHCASCHALNGTGDTVFGRNMYPKAADLRDHETQKLTDGELYYVVSNGVRFTGMPAFGGEDSPEEIWKLVLFIRHLPQLTSEELKTMQRMASETEREDGEEKGAPEPAQTHTHMPNAEPHKH
jgi:mono/diheme cytochrome c family protein